MLVYAASCLLPVSGPPIVGAGLAVKGGRIHAVGTLAVARAAAGEDAEVRDLGDAVILPGLVNAHTHLELSWLESDPPRGDDYVGWLRDLLAKRSVEDLAHARSCAALQIDRIEARGTVAVGDVSNHGWTAGLLARSGLHAVVFLEIYEPRADRARQKIEDAVGVLDRLAADDALRAAGDRVRVVPAPHAPHTTSAPLLRALSGSAAAAGQPWSIHVAESPAESALLADGSGPLADLMRERGVWDETWEPPGLSPVAYLDRLRVLSPRTLAVHAVQVGPRDQTILQSRGVTVVACPRSNRRLGVGVAPVHALLMAGISVALGTDSLATTPDLDLFAEMQALCEQVPALARPAVLRMATLNGARALGLGDRLGTLEEGKLACAIVVPLSDRDTDPYEVLCSQPERVYRLAHAPWRPAAA